MVVLHKICKPARRAAALLLTVCVASTAFARAADTYKTTTRVNFRTGASLDAEVIRTLSSGEPVEVLEYDAANWSMVSIDGKTGYIKSEYLLPDSASETAGVTQPDSGSAETQDVAETSEAAAKSTVYKTVTRVNFRTGASLDAAVIKTLNIGVPVEMLAYDEQNWSQVSLDGTVGFIKSEYLINADAYVGAVAVNGVELVEWAAVKTFLPLKRQLQITDVRTGQVYFMQSFSNGQHADVEPLTKSDTAILLKTYGGKWSWDPRPVWVTFNGRTIAASINGMPHGGGTIADNGMNGQVCLHFLGSKTHNGNKSFENQHQAGVTEAWNAARQ